MKKLIPGFLLITFVSLLIYAQEPTTTEEIVVTARRTALKYSEIPENITVLTAKDLARMPVNDLAEALSLVTGVDLQPNGPFGQPSSLTIQGCHPRQVRIMVDGVLLNTQSNAFADPSQIPIENVERIEIIKGTGSSAWGSSLGGVINVVTKSPPPKPGTQGNFTFSGGWGDYGFWTRVLEISGRIGKLGYYIWENNLNTNSEFRPNSEILNQKASAKFNYLLTDQVNLETSLHYNGADIGGFEFKPYNTGYNYFYNTRYGSCKLAFLPQDWGDFNITAKFSDQTSKRQDYSLTTGAITEASHHNIFAGIDLASNLLVAKNQTLLIGADLGRDKLESDLMRDIEVLRRQGYYANYHISLGEKYDLNLGSRYDRNESYGKAFSPSAGVVYHLPVAESLLRLSWARAFNAPPLLFKYQAVNPNPDLKAERAPAVYEFSAETKPVERLWLKFATYRAEVKDYAQFNWTTFKMENIGRIRRQGMESELRYGLRQDLETQTGWSLNRVEDRETGNIVRGNGVARATYNLGLNYHYQERLNINLKGNYHFWNEPAANKPNDRKFVWDLLASYDLPSLLKDKSDNQTSIFIGVYNILNSHYWYNYLYPLPGRRVELGLKYSF